MTDSRHLDYYFQTGLSNLADTNMFMVFILRRTINRRSCIVTVAHLVNNAVHDQVKVKIVQAGFQEAGSAPYDIQKLERVEIPSLPERSSSPKALSSDENEDSVAERGRVARLSPSRRKHLRHSLRMSLCRAYRQTELIALSKFVPRQREVLYRGGLPHIQASKINYRTTQKE